MSSLNESYLLSVIKTAAVIFRALPFGLSLWMARVVGGTGYYLLPKKRAVVYANLRIVFAGRKTPQEIRRTAKNVFINFAQSFVELFCLPKIKRLGFQHFVRLEGREHIEQALAKGKGVIFLALHSGSWELGSMVNGLCGHSYNVVANLQTREPELNDLLNEYRIIAGAKVIAAGVATREIIRALRNNEIVSLVLDQGGKDGVAVKFLGKTASMSTGAVRIGLKYGVPVCPAWIVRTSHTRHCLRIFPSLDLCAHEDMDKGLLEATRRAAQHFECLIYEHPDEYMWFYKVFKYSTESRVLILGDDKTGHARQSQAAAQILTRSLAAHGKSVEERLVPVHFKSVGAEKMFRFYAFFAQAFKFLVREEVLQFFLTTEAYHALTAYSADFIISCGSTAGSMNFFLSRCYGAKSICLLKAGLVSWDQFHLVIVPEHDRPSVSKNARLVTTKAALNLITPEYLKEQSAQLLNHYSHLKSNVRPKIGVLLGGDTKGIAFDEAQIRLLLRQLKEAAAHFNADIVLTTSRRTSPAIDDLAAKELKGFERCPLCIIANSQDIPSAVGGILGISDIVIVSGESISMVSEAVCSGKRTIVFSPAGDYPNGRALTKYDHFVLGLNEGGFLLACAVKDLSTAIHSVMRNKLTFKALNDRAAVQSAIEEII
ncbi:MAG: mitochondrial fission ELM1 family protein [Candidatus Omnitrophica bacterium]|nr:mitochondrial fission ELM1 family protein [Candidatus Omnitrophota bacterium]